MFRIVCGRVFSSSYMFVCVRKKRRFVIDVVFEETLFLRPDPLGIRP